MEERAIYVDIDPNDNHDAEPELLFDSHYRAKQIMLDYGTEPLIKAGSPISASGKVSNNASAIGILKRDCYRHLTSVGDVIIGGYIKSDIAQSHSGIEISDAARSAMSRLAFIGADGIPQPAAGGGGNFIITVTQSDTGSLNADKSIEEINSAFLSGKTIMLRINYGGSSDTYIPLKEASYKDNGDCGYHFDSIMLMSSNLYLMRLYIGIAGVSKSLYQLTATSVE